MEAAVLDRALDELAAHGLDGLRVERIAAAAEVNKTSIYRRWPTREALISAALGRVHDDLAGALGDTGSLTGDLGALVDGVAWFLERPVGLALARAALSAGDSPELAQLARARLEGAAVAPVIALVTRAVARGEWRDGLDPVAVLGLVVGAVLHRRLLERAPVTPEWRESVVGLVARGARP